jgi:hypothetical protein
MNFLRRGDHAGGDRAAMTPFRRQPQPSAPSPAYAFAPIPPPWTTEQVAPQGFPAAASPEQPVSRRLPTVEELAERVTREMPVVARRAPRTEAVAESPDFHLPRFPADLALAALPKVTYPRPACLPGDYARAMHVVSVLTGTVTPSVWHRVAVEVAVTSDEEIAAWERHRYADQMRRLDAANLAVAVVRS